MTNKVNEIIGLHGTKEYQRLMFEKTGIKEIEETCEGTEENQHVTVYKQHNTRTGAIYCPKCLTIKRDADQLPIDSEWVHNMSLNNTKRFFEKNSLVSNLNFFAWGFGGYKSKNSEQKGIVEDLKIITNKIIHEDKKLNLFISGGTGRGKTHLGASVLNNINELSNKEGKGKKCLCMNINLLASKLRESYSDPQKLQEAYYKSIMKQADILMIDDLGAEIGGLNTKREAADYITNVLYEVMDAREDKVTIVTSNLTWEQVKQKYDARFVSRLSIGLSKKEFKETDDYRPKMIR